MAAPDYANTRIYPLASLGASTDDIRHALATLFEPDLAKFNGEVFNPTKLSAEINQQYHLGITDDVIAGFAEIFLARGWLKEVLQGENRAFTVACPPSSQVPAELDQFTETAKQLAIQFREFITTISPLSQVNLTDAELIDSLVEWLLLLDRAGEQGVKGVSTTYRVGSKIILSVDDKMEGGAPSESTFLAARFVEHLFEGDSPFVPFLIELSEVGLVTEVVRDFQRPSSAVSKSDLSIYLDAPLAMDYLGLSGKPQQASLDIMLKGIRALGANVRMFRESVDEMQSALHALLARSVPERTGPTADALRRREVLEPFVRQVAAQPDKFLAAKGIGILEENLDMFPNQHRFFTRNAYEELYSQISWVKEDAARHHDALIATLAFRKRLGKRSSDIFESKHVVVTRNPTFPNLARRIALAHSFIGPSHVGPVIHQRQLATAVWLRIGSGTDVEIPRSYILSACRRVLVLRKNIVDRVHQFKETLSAEQAEQLEILMASDRSAQVLMDKTLGSANLIDSANIEKLLDEMKAAQIAEFEQARKEEVREIERRSKAREKELGSSLAAANQTAVDAMTEAQKHQQALLMIFEKMLSKVNRRIGRVRAAYGAVLAVLLSVVTALGFFWNGGNALISSLVFVVVLVGTFVVQFSPVLRARLLDRWFYRKDHQIFDQTCLEFGLSTDDALARVSYDGHAFRKLI